MAAQAKRKDVLDALMDSGRKMSRASLVFRDQVADAVGLHVTDAECMDYLLEAGSATAGVLAGITGLTTGSVTTMIDRLQKAGFVTREADRNDKRKVIVKPVMKKVDKISPYYDALVKDALDLYAGYTVAELQLLKDYNDKLTALYEKQIERIRNEE